MPRFRHHVNPLKLEHVGRAPGPLALPAGRPVEVELGCAEGEWLIERAHEEPHGFYVGLEIRLGLVEEVNRRTARTGLGDRVHAVYANITMDLGVLFERAAVDRFVLNFPDPWFKRRHKKRRVLNAELAETLALRLKPEGELFFQSDVWDLALDAMATLEATDALENTRAPWSFAPSSPFGVRSRRERRSLASGRRVWRMLYRKR